jgi:hypothetical protein
LIGSQTVGIPVIDGVGQVVFSPNGLHFFIYGTVSTTQGAYLNLYDFDRCTGLLSNHQQYHFISNGWGGCSFSPNSRFLYVNYFTKAYQYDLEAPDVWASRIQVALYDGFLDPLNTTFYLMQLGPDGKIYANSPSGVKSLHVIHNPDEKGLNCEYQQHGVSLPTYNAFSIPSFPNYRLGPLDGSPCDTIGLDNSPISWWRSEADTLESLRVNFHDLSYYEPNAWLWDFGDGSSGSDERHPVHNFPEPGDYLVCLTVSNANTSHTLCRTLHFTVSAIDNPDVKNSISVSPNPFDNVLNITQSLPLRSPFFYLYDQMGRKVIVQSLALGITQVESSTLPVGIYFWEVIAAGEPILRGKIIKS